jgi:hypothetical protein
MYFEIIGALSEIEVIAEGRSVRGRRKLRKRYGGRRGRKLKGVGIVLLANGLLRRAEVHWYEAHGVGSAG